MVKILEMPHTLSSSKVRSPQRYLQRGQRKKRKTTGNPMYEKIKQLPVNIMTVQKNDQDIRQNTTEQH